MWERPSQPCSPCPLLLSPPPPGSPFCSQLFSCIQRCLGCLRLRTWYPKTAPCPPPTELGSSDFPQPGIHRGCVESMWCGSLWCLPAQSTRTLAGHGFSPIPFILPVPTTQHLMTISPYPILLLLPLASSHFFLFLLPFCKASDIQSQGSYT
jgi:hypothetical protein